MPASTNLDHFERRGINSGWEFIIIGGRKAGSRLGRVGEGRQFAGGASSTITLCQGISSNTKLPNGDKTF